MQARWFAAVGCRIGCWVVAFGLAEVLTVKAPTGTPPTIAGIHIPPG